MVSLTRWGKGLGALGKALTSPGGFRTLASAGAKYGRNVVTAFPHALDIANGIRGAVRNPGLAARAFKCRFLGRDPIDMATGEMVMQMTDFELPALLPLVLERTYSSAYGVGRWFGPSWSSFLDQRLEVDEQGVCFAYTEAVLLTYPPLAPGESSLPDEGPRLPLSRRSDGAYSVHEPETGRTFWFAPPPEETRVVLPLAGISDRNGNRIDLGYDPVTGWLAEIDHTGGYRVEVDCEAGRITEFRLAGNETTIVRYAYDAYGRLTDVINSSGLPLKFGYDRHNRITSWTDRNGTWYRYQYDGEGRVIRTSGSAHCLDGEMRYDSANRVTVEVNSLGAETAYHYNETGQVERVVNPLGNATSRTWDRYHRKTSETDALGRVTRYAYDDRDGLIEVVRADGSSTRYERNEFCQPTVVVQPDGSLWQRRFDSAGNLIEVTDPTGAVVRYGYTGPGLPATVTNALGEVTRLKTDDAGLVTEVTDPLEASTTLLRDAFGRVVAVTDPLGNTVRQEWTVEGLLAARTLPDGSSEHWRYDPEGNLVEYTDALGMPSSIEYAAFDLPSVRTDLRGTQAAFTYDTELRLTSVTDPRGLVWRYEYDLAGQLVRETDYDGRVLTYQHDAAGGLTERVNGAGQFIRYGRDRLGRVVARQTAEATTHLAYDVLDNLVRTANPDAEVAFDRDALGRVLAETVNGRTISSVYDAVGRRTARRLPTGTQTRWAYDAAGQAQAMDTSGHRMTFVHDAAGRETERRLGHDAVLRQSWGRASTLVSQTVALDAGTPGSEKVLAHRDYAYRADGFLTSSSDLAKGRLSYQLDELGQILEVAGPDRSESYRYGPSGDLVSAQWPQLSGPDAADARGSREMAGSRISRAGRVHYAYDGQGRMTERRTTTLSGKKLLWRYRWDAEDRLRSCWSADGTLWEYSYDSVGRRLGKRAIAADGRVLRTVTFVWDGLELAERQVFPGEPTGEPTGSPTGEPAAGGSATGAEVTTWVSHPRTQEILGQREVVWVDGVPGPERFRAVIGAPNGEPLEVVEEGRLHPVASGRSLWGAQAPEASLRTGFVGQYVDEESQLHYNVLRYYCPEQGAFASPDPLNLIPGLNARHYSVNPLALVDPLGLTPYSPAAPTPRTITLANGTTINTGDYATRVAQTQGRHVKGHPNYDPVAAKSYFNKVEEAQKVLDDFHSGSATVLGTKANGDVVVRTGSVTGYNNNPRAGFVDQATDVFFIKGTTHPSVVPYNPTWQPRP